MALFKSFVDVFGNSFPTLEVGIFQTTDKPGSGGVKESSLQYVPPGRGEKKVNLLHYSAWAKHKFTLKLNRGPKNLFVLVPGGDTHILHTFITPLIEAFLTHGYLSEIMHVKVSLL